MSRCENCIHSGMCKMEIAPNWNSENCSWCKPTADVVPKSEEERYIPLVDENLTRVFEHYKKTIAREIFEEIDEILRIHTEGGYYVNLAWFPEQLDVDTKEAIAELKKKYTEDQI